MARRPARRRRKLWPNCAPAIASSRLNSRSSPEPFSSSISAFHHKGRGNRQDLVHSCAYCFRYCLPRCERASVDELQRKLNLPGSSRRFADNAKSASPKKVRGQPEIYQVEYIEELGAELDGAKLRLAAAAKGRVLDQRQIVILKAGAAERISAQGAKSAMVGASAAGDTYGNVKE